MTFASAMAVAGLACAVSVLCVSAATRRLARRASLALAVRPEIVLFGDSITQQSFAPGGWGSRIADHYQRTADVRLRGFSGYNTRWALQLLPRVFAPEGLAPLLVTVLLGANDANLPAPINGLPAEASRQHVPLDEYVANLRAIVRAIRAVGDGSARVLLITPPPCDDKAWHAQCVSAHGVPREAEPNRRLEVTQLYAEACARLGREDGIPTADLHSALLARDDWRHLLRDGLHPNAAGGAAIADTVLDAIRAHYPEFQPASYADPEPARLPLDFPDHKAVDVADVAGSFRRHAEGRQ